MEDYENFEVMAIIEDIKNKYIGNIALKALREFYRRNFRNGRSDESFLMWIETELEKL